jgi:alpha/beta superfamily hydrolase
MADDSPVLPLTVTSDPPDGAITLDGQLRRPARADLLAVVAHAHPQYGGSMHVNVVTALFDALPAVGVAVARFDFRGVGRSSGRHDGGPGEQRDLLAVVDHLVDTIDLPVVLCGYSFGAEVALSCDHERAVGWFGVAPIGRLFSTWPAGEDHRPTVLAVAEHDQYAPPAAVSAFTAAWEATTIGEVAMADHFFAGRTAAVVDAFVDALPRFRA